MIPYSVFIPVLNEAAIIQANTRRLLAFLRSLGREFELIIGSNGSTDATAALGAALAQAEPEVRFFVLPRAGPGRAFARALELFQGDSLITLDMDLTVDLEFVPRALELLAEFAVVVGSKRQGRQERSLPRIAGSGLYITCARLLLGLPYLDYSLGAKAFRGQVLRRFRGAVDQHTAYITNLVFAARQAGLPIVELPVSCSDTRSSRFNLGHEAAYRLAWLFRLFWQGRLLRRFPSN